MFRLISGFISHLMKSIASGRGGSPDDLGGAGVPARTKPKPPVLVGTDAKPIPDVDSPV